MPSEKEIEAAIEAVYQTDRGLSTWLFTFRSKQNIRAIAKAALEAAEEVRAQELLDKTVYSLTI